MATILERLKNQFRELPSSILSPIIPPKDKFFGLHRTYCLGGKAVGDTSEPLNKYIWQGEYEPDTGSFSFWRDDLGKSTKQEIFTDRDNVLSIDLCFDQNMRPFICFERNYESYYWSFNAEHSTFDEIKLENATRFPRCLLYIEKDYQIPNSDIVIAYIRNGNLYIRVQRERFLNEYQLAYDPKKTMLWKISLSDDDRFLLQWR